MRLTPAKIEANRQKETSIIYRRRPRAGGDYTYRLRSKGPGANNVKVKKAKFLLVYKDFLFGFWFSGDFFYPQITWIGADQEPKAKAIHRFRRLHRLEKTKNKGFEAGFLAVLGMTYERCGLAEFQKSVQSVDKSLSNYRLTHRSE